MEPEQQAAGSADFLLHAGTEIRDFAIDLEQVKCLILKAGSAFEGNGSTIQSRAASSFQTALSLDSPLAESHYQLGSCHSQTLAPASLKHLQTASKLNPKSSKIYFAQARVYRRLGNQIRAQEEQEVYEALNVEENSSTQVKLMTKHKSIPVDLPTEE
jgi:hypothetical protein